ncbi:MAG TPA: hypothetical protein VMU37_09010 [Caulobacteraceae bacterium]|nr:hypothetical protein [Caulobacteraceae bacterium]
MAGSREPSQDDYDSLLQRIYSAAVEPQLWPDLLERLSDLIGGGGGALIKQNQADGTGSAAVIRLDDAAADVYFGFETRNVLLRVSNPYDFMRTWSPRILTDEDWMPKEELVRSEYYDAFLHPRDMHSVMMIRLARSGLDTAHISIGRSRRHGQYEARDLEVARRLHPHLIHAFTLGEKVSFLRGLGEGLAAVVGPSPYSVMLLGQDGRVRYLNTLAEALTGRNCGISLREGRLVATTSDANSRLQALIGLATQRLARARRGGSMVAPRPNGGLPLSIMVSPVVREAFATLRSDPAAIVCITDPEMGTDVPSERLRELFGFTPAETRVALSLFEGRNLAEAAAELGLSVHTVRIHLSRVFAKSQTNRQADLVRVMSRSIGVNLS